MTAAHIARVEELIADGSLTDKLARQVFEGVIAGEDVDTVVQARGSWLLVTTPRCSRRSSKPWPINQTSPRRSKAAKFRPRVRSWVR